MRDTKQILLGSVAAASLLAGCAMTPRSARLQGGIVHAYAQSSSGDNANLYWFETPSGPVVIDAPLLTSEAKKLRNGMVRPYRIYVSEARPERFAGLAALREGEVPVYTTPAVASEIKDKGDERLALARRRHGSDVSAHVDAPSPAVEERTSDMVGEVEIELMPIGPTRADASLAILLRKTNELIAGDVVDADEHLDLSNGKSALWGQKLIELKALNPKYVYPGHGSPGGAELINQTLEYITFFSEAVKEKVKPGAPAKINAIDLSDIKKKLVARFPKHGATGRMDASIDAEYSVQLAALPAATAAAPSEPGPLAPSSAPVIAPAPATAPAVAPAPAPAAKSNDKPAAKANDKPAAKPSDKPAPAPAAAPAAAQAADDETPGAKKPSKTKTKPMSAAELDELLDGSTPSKKKKK